MAGKLKIGIIGGTGLEDPKIFENAREVEYDTPFGKPSDKLKEGTIHGVPCVLVSRHGKKHDIDPSGINYRANLWALKQAGVHAILASHASGSLVEEIKPGDFVFVDSFIDRTQKRQQTFYGKGEGELKGVCHIPCHPAYNEKLRQTLIKTAEALQIPHHKNGTIICIEGPRYSSRAESNMFRQWGATVINMTVVPEVILALELGIPYQSIALSTDYDCWKDDTEGVSVDLVDRTLKANAENAKKLLVEAVAALANRDKEMLEEYEKAQKTAKASIMG
ncbi:unnamed protein product [Bursaphelenchus okinawaensis]|uniref:S-methyl-5'-thioadenosine phosphorylase n=1 Tax=Bursaphelenchus okinawaensis TaxID=465554 RepID=A0A811LCW2_9BILA|nr:unnamed protein product [Bursaphelenchus okinawaensis]CAG9120781.1 unnamed protein product [Bursaphelenchus okinawaensis]